MSDKQKIEQLLKPDWNYFFGGSSKGGKNFDRYYFAEINGVRVEMHSSNRGTVYAVGNIDKAAKKYKTETELLNSLNTNNHG
jgi:hypothetical protein